MKKILNGRKIKKESKSNQEKEEISFWNIFFIICIFLSIIFSIALCFFIKEFNENIKKHNLDYNWPKLSELIPSLYILPLIMAFKTAIELLSKGLVESCLAKKYKQPKNEEFKKLGNIYRHKLSRHIYKIIFYVGITIFGYHALYDLPYFPKSMLGNGNLPSMFLKGFPDSYFYERTPLLILYYNICLAYFLNDFIFLFIMERQSDFINMLLHHICTISLIIFSFITNYSNIGSLIIFCHMESDILLHVSRFLLQTDNSIFLIGFVGVIFTINFIYMRQYVFGEMIYTVYKYVTWKWGIITTTLWLFSAILYIMHLRWSYILLSKLAKLFETKKNVGDDINYDKLVKNHIKDNLTDNKNKEK